MKNDDDEDGDTFSLIYSEQMVELIIAEYDGVRYSNRLHIDVVSVFRLDGYCIIIYSHYLFQITNGTYNSVIGDAAQSVLTLPSDRSYNGQMLRCEARNEAIDYALKANVSLRVYCKFFYRSVGYEIKRLGFDFQPRLKSFL